MSLHLRPGSLIVFEGLDRSGKSTQIKRLSAFDWGTPGPRFTHMPSGLTELTGNIYSLTENSQISSPLEGNCCTSPATPKTSGQSLTLETDTASFSTAGGGPLLPTAGTDPGSRGPGSVSRCSSG